MAGNCRGLGRADGVNGGLVDVSCPNCGEDAPEDAKWCEACGQDLNAEPLPACVACGEREVAEEGYCLSCGHKQPEERDHMEFDEGPVVAVTDRGKRHRHNEDAVAIGASRDGAAVLVVCDGVSSTPGSAQASLRAAAAARDLLVAGLNYDEAGQADAGVDPGPAADAAEADAAAAEVDAAAAEVDADAAGGAASTSPVADDDLSSAIPASPEIETEAGTVELDVEVLLARAAEAAQAEAAATTLSEDGAIDVNAPHSDGGPPSSTFVAVVARPLDDGAELVTAWVGDSRAYWIGDEPTRLTDVDHEVAGSLARWLGADSVNATPDIVRTTVSGTGHLVVCSDGLWRYAGEAGELAALLGRLTGDGLQGLGLASAMVDFANDGGGHDNISVAVWSNDTVAGVATDTAEETAEETGEPDGGQDTAATGAVAEEAAEAEHD